MSRRSLRLLSEGWLSKSSKKALTILSLGWLGIFTAISEVYNPYRLKSFYTTSLSLKSEVETEIDLKSFYLTLLKLLTLKANNTPC